MGYKILDVKADIHEEVHDHFKNLLFDSNWNVTIDRIEVDVLDIVDKHFEKIER